MYKLFIILFILTLFLSLKKNIEPFYFYPLSDIINNKYKVININNHYALTNTSDNLKERCMIISHGNAGNITYRENLFDILKDYNGDIYCYEYQGFGLCKGQVSIKGCLEEHIFWLEELSNKYEKIDLWGESIGGGVITETICLVNNDSILNKINTIYFQSTFSSLKNVIYNMNFIYGVIYTLLGLDDFNTFNNLNNPKFKNKKIKILHSRNDEMISFEEALNNLVLGKINKLDIQLIEIGGTHNNPIFNNLYF
jgi:esterase/lipase